MEIEQATTQEVFEPTIEDMIQTENGIPTTTSLVIAQAFEKEHKDVLRAIYNMECSPEFNERNFAPVGYKDAKGEIRPAYRLTRDGFASSSRWASPAKRRRHGRNVSLKPSMRWKRPCSDNASGKRRPPKNRNSPPPDMGEARVLPLRTKAHQGPDGIPPRCPQYGMPPPESPT